MGRFFDAVTYGLPVLDLGWRVAVYPNGTLLADAITQEATIQAGHGNLLDPATASVLPCYYIRTTGDYLADGEQESRDHGWRDVVTLTGAVPVRYRISGPKIHNP